MPRRATHQPSLFDEPRESPTGSLADTMQEHPGEDFIQGVRDELNALLALVRAAAEFPWRDAIEISLVEKRFRDDSQWLPRCEAVALRRAFGAEMDRLYDVADAADEARSAMWGMPGFER